MKPILKRLLDLEEKQKEPKELCIFFFWVREGYEEEDVMKQKMEYTKLFKDLPVDTFYQIFTLRTEEMTYGDFMQNIRKQRSPEQWCKSQTIRGVPCNDYKDVVKKLNRL